MPVPRNIQHSLRLSLLLISAVALFAWWMAARTDQEMRRELLALTGMLGQAVNTEHAADLTGTAADLNTHGYQEIKAQLAAIRSANPRCRFLYLVGRKTDRTIFFLADSEPVNSPDYSPPGEIYPEASAVFHRVFDAGQSGVEGPLPDRWGIWVSAVVPLTNPQTGKVFALFGMDVDARNWRWNVVTRLALPVGLMLVLSFSYVLLHRSDASSRAQQVKLTESELHLQTILESTADGILAVDNQGKVIKVNRRFVELWHVPPAILASASQLEMARFITNQLTDSELALERMQSTIRLGTVDVKVLHTKDGRSFERTFTPMTQDGNVVGRVWVMHDITGRQQAEESHARLATAVEQSAETILITNLQGTILYVNPAYEKNTGYTYAEAVGQNPRMLKSGRQDAAFYRRMWDQLQRGEVWTGHFINRRKDGSFFEEDATISPVRDTAGKIINYVAVKRDVTREKQLQSQLLHAQKMEAVGQLAGGIAHDFNNILTSLLMQAELVGLVESLPTEAREGLAEIRADANRAANLTRQLLLFSRRQVLQPQTLDLNEVVRNMGKMLRRIIGEDVHMQEQLYPGALFIWADVGMLEQVLMNLTVNSRDAMAGGGRLRLATTTQVVTESPASCPEALPGRYVCLEVSDTGGGIPPAVLPHIFEPFFTTKAVGKGTGLGLATVFGIVKQHHGWIQVDNQPGHGVTFQVFLPASQRTEPASRVPASTPKPQRGVETILVVEDDAGVRRLMTQTLTHHGYQMLEAANGIEALGVWQAHSQTVTLLLTDLVMPGGLTGQELARRLQADRPDLKVVFSSGYSHEISGWKTPLHGSGNFISKPFAPEQLLRTIRQSLDA